VQKVVDKVGVAAPGRVDRPGKPSRSARWTFPKQLAIVEEHVRDARSPKGRAHALTRWQAARGARACSSSRPCSSTVDHTMKAMTD